ncbi:MAG: hypothetical protein HY231_27375 [Acidobacteria bacterium]|nr:hypothetical protein [Acidobacteriota bacterium]
MKDHQRLYHSFPPARHVTKLWLQEPGSPSPMWRNEKLKRRGTARPESRHALWLEADHPCRRAAVVMVHSRLGNG